MKQNILVVISNQNHPLCIQFWLNLQVLQNLDTYLVAEKTSLHFHNCSVKHVSSSDILGKGLSFCCSKVIKSSPQKNRLKWCPTCGFQKSAAHEKDYKLNLSHISQISQMIFNSVPPRSNLSDWRGERWCWRTMGEEPLVQFIVIFSTTKKHSYHSNEKDNYLHRNYEDISGVASRRRPVVLRK